MNTTTDKTRDADKEYLELLAVLHDEAGKVSIVKKSLAGMIHELGYNKAIGTVLSNEQLVKYPDGKLGGWKWNTIRPNLEMAKKLREKLREYVNDAGRRAYQNKIHKQNSEHKNHKVEKAVVETTESVVNGERKLREVRKLDTSKNFKATFAIVNILSQLDVMPTVDEFKDMVKHAEELKKQKIF